MFLLVGEGIRLRRIRTALIALLAFAAGLLVALLVLPGSKKVNDWRQAVAARVQGAVGIAVQSTVLHADADGWAEVIVQNRGGARARVTVVPDRGEQVTIEGEEVVLNPWQRKTIRFRVHGIDKEVKVLVQLRPMDSGTQIGSILRNSNDRSSVNVVFSVPVRVIRGM